MGVEGKPYKQRKKGLAVNTQCRSFEDVNAQLRVIQDLIKGGIENVREEFLVENSVVRTAQYPRGHRELIARGVLWLDPSSANVDQIVKVYYDRRAPEVDTGAQTNITFYRQPDRNPRFIERPQVFTEVAGHTYDATGVPPGTPGRYQGTADVGAAAMPPWHLRYPTAKGETVDDRSFFYLHWEGPASGAQSNRYYVHWIAIGQGEGS